MDAFKHSVINNVAACVQSQYPVYRFTYTEFRAELVHPEEGDEDGEVDVSHEHIQRVHLVQVFPDVATAKKAQPTSLSFALERVQASIDNNEGHANDRIPTRVLDSLFNCIEHQNWLTQDIFDRIYDSETGKRRPCGYDCQASPHYTLYEAWGCSKWLLFDIERVA